MKCENCNKDIYMGVPDSTHKWLCQECFDKLNKKFNISVINWKMIILILIAVIIINIIFKYFGINMW